MTADTRDSDRLWDWAGLMGAVSGVAAVAIWYFADTGNHRAGLSTDSWGVWWMAYGLAIGAAFCGLVLQLALRRRRGQIGDRTRAALGLVSAIAAGVVAPAAASVWPQPAVRAGSLDLRWCLLLTVTAGCAIGVQIARHCTVGTAGSDAETEHGRRDREPAPQSAERPATSARS